MSHECVLRSPDGAYGPAVEVCYENSDGEFWVTNYEYGSQVNYCPVCGAAAPVMIRQKQENGSEDDFDELEPIDTESSPIDTKTQSIDTEAPEVNERMRIDANYNIGISPSKE